MTAENILSKNNHTDSTAYDTNQIQ